MNLTAAYRNLQLDPNKIQQVTAFEALCWKHVFHHASLQWVQYAQSGALPLTWVTHVNESRLQEYDDTLDTIVEDFVRVYADLLWPVTANMRSHLTVSAGSQLVAIPHQRRASSGVIQRIESLRNVRATERMYVVESKIGRRLREFFSKLVVTRAIPSNNDSTTVQLLLSVLEWEIPQAAVEPARYPCPHAGCNMTHASSEAVIVHQYLDHSAIVHAAQVIDLTADDDTSDRVQLPPSNLNDTQTAPETPSHTGLLALFPCPHDGCNLVFSMSEVLASHQELEHHATSFADQLFQDDSHGSRPLIPPGMLPPPWVDMQTGDFNHITVPPVAASTLFTVSREGPSRVSAGSNALMANQDLAHPMSSELPTHVAPDVEDRQGGLDAANVIDLGDSDDDEGDISGLLCSHTGCPLRFPDWASFDAHTQQPHVDSSRALHSGEIYSTNDVADHEDLHDIRDGSMLEHNNTKFSSMKDPGTGFSAGSVSGDILRWRNMAGERESDGCSDLVISKTRDVREMRSEPRWRKK